MPFGTSLVSLSVNVGQLQDVRGLARATYNENDADESPVSALLSATSDSGSAMLPADKLSVSRFGFMNLVFFKAILWWQ